LWFVRFAHSPTNFLFWLDRLIFSVSINSHPDGRLRPLITNCAMTWFIKYIHHWNLQFLNTQF
jgi:hypothetical protein